MTRMQKKQIDQAVLERLTEESRTGRSMEPRELANDLGMGSRDARWSLLRLQRAGLATECDGYWLATSQLDNRAALLVGKSMGCCDCDGEFASADEQDAHAKATGHNVEG